MKKSVIALLGLAVILGGCSNRVSYGDAQAVETTTIDFGSTDLQKIAGEMVDSMLSSGSVAAITSNSRPIAFVDSIKNKTSEHIDTESITDTISTKMLNSGKFRFVDMDRVESVRKQLNFQNNDQLVNQSTAIQFGKMVGAQYMLYGNLSSIVKSAGSDKDVYYKMTMRLMDLETGLIEWADETEIRKQASKSLLGL
ncbi:MULTISPECIES: penicillin-binding protein activator LpoB [Vibrio]|uniref:Penicillin-binding protein activator LpoB n=1 Tax=Vibrio proteolyticus NBRC 13287 TaxID=1219065 RepID=U3B8J2_VIBPR|nr:MULTISPECIES: penicillin-binding protein activator LpoB [Vibrio]NAW59832.1 penicillin-binding protein activator LpoB [Vibrio sp. V36_P2S2PM302]NAX19673.1 penicillin-binding protein activator LpoB [Vibrio sp. V39_P1S14PM300]NAX24733.1 penicillin-binding protein activator LpoB [Vibrio sp. V38_P2S17PM301]NAX32687.1 penicillin-binding protein activator LpoB [Vibrio sp. V37_P2S8PM304]GAD66164.1 penicillin-binding protein activator LpoB [Vibrio proteolyticus NBRC 13287]